MTTRHAFAIHDNDAYLGCTSRRTRHSKGDAVDTLDWDKLRIFHAVADAGSLTHAGETLHLSQSAVSRQIRALEEAFDSTLFHRHARGLILTEQGELLFEATAAMAKRLDTAAARIRDSEDAIHGELRVTTTTGFGSMWLAPRLAALYQRHPDMRIDLMLEERVLDLPMREADVAIRMKEPAQADLIRRRLMNIRMMMFATPQYLDEHGRPGKPSDLRQHRLILQQPGAPQVAAGARLSAEMMAHEPVSTLKVNSYFGALQATINHLGIGVLPEYLVPDFGQLERVLPLIESDEVPIFLAYPEELRQSRRVAAFRDFVTEEVAAHRRIHRE